MSIPLDFYTDTLGQSAVTPFITNIFALYSIPTDPSSKQEITTRLTTATAKAATFFPWLTGRVTHESPTSLWKITPDPSITTGGEPSLIIINDYTEDPTHPTFAEMKLRNFPMRYLAEGSYVTRRNFPGHPDEKYLEDEPHPVFRLHINFLRGGVLIGSSTSHLVCDATGHTTIVEIVSRCCQVDPKFTEEELRLWNQPRLGMVDTSDVELKSDLAAMPEQPRWYPRYDDPPNPVNGEWETFLITTKAQRELKNLATETMAEDAPFVSTDDAITALFLKHVTKARGYKPGQHIFGFRSVDMRELVGVHKDHPGFMAMYVPTIPPIDRIVNEPLGLLAGQLRKDINPLVLVTITKQWIKELEQPGATLMPNVFVYDRSKDFIFTSWAKRNNYHIDLGFGKSPDCVRSSATHEIGGMTILMPRKKNGDVEVCTCLTRRVFGQLLEDEEFMRFAIPL